MRATLATSSVYLTFGKVATKLIVVTRGVVRRRLHVPDTVPAVHEGRGAAVYRVVGHLLGASVSLSSISPAVAHMSSGASPSLAGRLVTACYNGDLPSAKAVVAAGASVNEKGMVRSWDSTVLPLEVALVRQHHDVVVWLLSHGADPNGDYVMYYGAYGSTAGILQLLIDAGGDVNRSSGGWPPLFPAVAYDSEDTARVLLAQPSLDFTIKYDNKPPEQFARARGKPAAADMIAHEVSGKGSGCASVVCADGVCVCVALLWLTDRETSDAGTSSFVRLIAHVLWYGHD